MSSSKRSINHEDQTIVSPSPKKANNQRSTSKHPTAIRDWPLNFCRATKNDVSSTPHAGIRSGNVKDKKSPYVILSDDEVKSANRAIDPRLSPEYNPSTPPSTAPAKARLPHEDDAFSPGLYRSSGSAVTIGDSAIQNPSVARGIILTGMLPRDRLCYDHMNDINQALDRAAQLHFAGLSLVRKAGELHYNAVVKLQKNHDAASYHLERENESLRRQVENLHAKKHEADNAGELMRRLLDRAYFKAKGFGSYAAVSPDAEEAAITKGLDGYPVVLPDAVEAFDGAGDDLYDPEEE